jgi:predicted O-methyltransferase YrrM
MTNCDQQKKSEMIFPIIDDILDSGIVKDKNGNNIPLRGNIDREEGMFLYDLIAGNKSISQTLEIGFAFGISSLFICSALRLKESPFHIIIDPHQEKAYDDIGNLNLQRAGVTFYRLFKERSEFVLPRLLNQAPGSMDLVFIDGLHSFDQVALDFYYANRLLKVGGLIVFDDCSFFSISKVISYVLNFPAYEFHSQVRETSKRKMLLRFCLKLIPEFLYTNFLPIKVNNFYNRFRYTTMIAIRKLGEDKRGTRWFSNF